MHPTFDGYLGFYQFLAIMNETAMNIGVHVSWYTCACISVGSEGAGS